MVLTPYAVALRDRAARAREEAQRLLSPATATPLEDLEGALTLRCADAVAAWLAAPLHAAAQAELPRVRLVFAPEGEEDAAALRDGRVDLDVGTLDLVEPELVQRQLLVERYAFLVRRDHPLGPSPTALELVAHPHAAVSRRGRAEGPVDEALAAVGARRRVGVVVGSFLAAAVAVAGSELVAAVPGSVGGYLAQVLPVRVIGAPFPLPPVRIGMVWHPRSEHDPALRWLRAQVVAITSARDTEAG
jgi:DNA-binding transcriptional LysR family regulator